MNINGKRRMDTMDDLDVDDCMMDGMDIGTEMVEMEMDLKMETDWTSARVGPKSIRRKRMVMNTAKKIKLGQDILITNYFHLEGTKSQGIKNMMKKSHKYSNL